MSPSPVPSLPKWTWFKPTRTFEIDGRAWVTDGQLAVEATGAGRDIDGSLIVDLVTASRPSTYPPRRDGGYVVVDGMHFQAAYIDLVEALHPGAEWRSRSPDAIAAFASGRPVGAAMMIKRKGTEPCPPPKCPTCKGEGGPTCARCDGHGKAKCQCNGCGDEHTRECPVCDGARVGGPCADCNSTGRWSPVRGAS